MTQILCVKSLTLCFFHDFLPFQSAMRVTIAAVSAQVKTAQDVSGWQSGGRGWLAKTWKNKKTREVGHSTGNERRLESKEDEHKAIMIVMTDHLFPFCPCQTWVTVLAANTHFPLIRLQVFSHWGSRELVSCKSSTG